MVDRSQFAHLVSPLALARAATADNPKPYEWAAHLELLSDRLVSLRMRALGPKHSLLVTMPPRHGKSEMASVWFPTWAIAIDPLEKIILTSYEAEFAASWGRKVRKNVQHLYPILGAKILEDSRAAHRWETREGGGMTTAGVGGPITGKGAAILICDDPIKNAEEATSQVLRDNLWEWWTTTFLTRLEPDRRGHPPILVLILTRWHEDDLAGRLMASREFSETWDHLDLPALSRGPDVDALGRPEGAALWPERFDEAALEVQRRRIGSRAFISLYQQAPSPPEGAGIHRAWWRWYTDADCPPVGDFEQIIQSWDTTFKAVATSDFVAGGVLGRLTTPEGQTRFYLLDCTHEQLNGPDTLKAIYATDDLWPQARFAVIEDSASGSMILDILQRERGHISRGQTKSRQKEVRLHWGVNSTAAIVERGQVYLPKGRAWAQTLVDEAALFPNATHDDMVDMLVQGLEFLMPRAWAAENRTRRALLDAPAKDLVEQMSRQLFEKIHARLKIKRDESRNLEERGEQFPGL